MLVHRLSVGVLVVAFVAKLLGTSLTVSSGWPGGFIIPLFFMGATLGQITHHAFGDARVGVVCAALMVAANVGVTKTLLGSTLVVTEMGGLRLLPTTLLAAIDRVHAHEPDRSDPLAARARRDGAERVRLRSGAERAQHRGRHLVVTLRRATARVRC